MNMYARTHINIIHEFYILGKSMVHFSCNLLFPFYTLTYSFNVHWGNKMRRRFQEIASNQMKQRMKI